MGDDVRDLLPSAARGPPRQRAHLHHRQLCFVSCPPGHERGVMTFDGKLATGILDAKPGSRAAEKRRARAVQNGTMRDRTQDLLAIAERLGNEVSGPKPAMARPRAYALHPLATRRHSRQVSPELTHSFLRVLGSVFLSRSRARREGPPRRTAAPRGPYPPGQPPPRPGPTSPSSRRRPPASGRRFTLLPTNLLGELTSPPFWGALGLTLLPLSRRILRLAQLAKRTSMFDDPAQEIQDLTLVVKQDITGLNRAIEDLQVRWKN